MVATRRTSGALATLSLYFAVAFIPGSNAKADPCVPYISTHCICNQTSFMCACIDANEGGAITDLQTYWTLGLLDNCNPVDNGIPDKGRQIQVSLYTAGQSYPNCWPCNAGCNWGWNPVQAGNCANYGSGSLQVTQTSSSLVVRSQPMQWDNGLGRSNVVLNQDFRFARPNALQMTWTITNNESFTIDGTHEMPVAYLETRQSRPVAYTGNAPFTNAAVAEFTIGVNSFTDPVPTERWIAWLDAQGHGVALYVPQQSTAPTATWRLGKLGGSGVPAAHYMQNWASMRLTPGQSKSVVAYLVTGTVSEIRSAVYSLVGVN